MACFLMINQCSHRQLMSKVLQCYSHQQKKRQNPNSGSTLISVYIYQYTGEENIRISVSNIRHCLDVSSNSSKTNIETNIC